MWWNHSSVVKIHFCQCVLCKCSIKFKYIMSSFLTLAMHSLGAESVRNGVNVFFVQKTLLRSVGDIPLNPTLHKNNVNKVNIC